jgi:hypothetical protein
MQRGPAVGFHDQPTITPLVLEIPLRDGAFTARVTVPLEAYDQELWAICSAIITPIRERKNPPNPVKWVDEKSLHGSSAWERGETAPRTTADDSWRCIYCHAPIA